MTPFQNWDLKPAVQIRLNQNESRETTDDETRLKLKNKNGSMVLFQKHQLTKAF